MIIKIVLGGNLPTGARLKTDYSNQESRDTAIGRVRSGRRE